MLIPWSCCILLFGRAWAIDIDDECGQENCAISVLQRRVAQLSSNVAEALEEAEAQLSTGPPSFALCGNESYDKSQENCCGGKIYSLTSQGCCGNSTYNFAEQGCCNGDHVFTYGMETCTPPLQKPEGATPNVTFECAADWPPANYGSYWLRYCAAGLHMAWAMTPSCKVGWLSVKQDSLEDAAKKALDACQKKATAYNGETCYLFDQDGGGCRRQRCGDQMYDASVKACCNGKVYDRQTEGCCEGVIYKAQTEGCCQGRVYTAGAQSCCGGQSLYDSETHGCCLEKGPQVYRYGGFNCCRRPKGVCRIPPGRASCCS